MKKDIKYTLIDTFVRPTYEDYVEWCNANGFVPGEESSNDYYEYCDEMISINYNDEMDNIKFSPENDSPVIVTGVLGLWNGEQEIYPVKCRTLHEAIEDCMGHNDDIVVRFDNGVIYVESYHHDGTNRFTIRKMSARGLRDTNTWYGGATVNTKMKDCWFKKFKMI